MKTGTSCTRCANASICPAYDDRMLYGFCQGFVGVMEGKNSSENISSALLDEDLDVNAGAGMRREVFLNTGGKMEDDKKELSDAGKEAELHWKYVDGVLATHLVSQSERENAGHHYKTAFIHGWKHGQEAINGKAQG